MTKAGYALPLPDQEDQEGLSGLLRLDHCRWSWAGRHGGCKLMTLRGPHQVQCPATRSTPPRGMMNRDHHFLDFVTINLKSRRVLSHFLPCPLRSKTMPQKSDASLACGLCLCICVYVFRAATPSHCTYDWPRSIQSLKVPNISTIQPSQHPI